MTKRIKKTKLTYNTYKKIKELSKHVPDINIAIMITKDSIEADTFIDEKYELEYKILELRKKPNQKRSYKELNGFNKSQLISICKENKIIGYSKLPKYALIEYIQRHEFDMLVKKYFEKYNSTMYQKFDSLLTSSLYFQELLTVFNDMCDERMFLACHPIDHLFFINYCDNPPCIIPDDGYSFYFDVFLKLIALYDEFNGFNTSVF